MSNDWKQSITIPQPQGTFIVFDLSSIQVAENRIHEVAYVTPQKAGELLACFNTAHLELVTIIAKVELELRRAERHSDKLRSIIVLDKTKEILEQKGLTTSRSPSGSEDLRQAVLDDDDEYQDALDKVEEMRILGEFLRNKSKSIEMAYHSVKKLIGDTFIPNGRETRTNGYSSDETPLGEVTLNKAPVTPGRYGYVKPKI